LQYKPSLFQSYLGRVKTCSPASDLVSGPCQRCTSNSERSLREDKVPLSEVESRNRVGFDNDRSHCMRQLSGVSLSLVLLSHCIRVCIIKAQDAEKQKMASCMEYRGPPNHVERGYMSRGILIRWLWLR
jgi:hypothetical protein